MPSQPRLLYLGFAFPPGVAGLYPEAQPAGHLIETSIVKSLRPWFEIRSVGISWIEVDKVPPGDCSPGLPHELNLLDRYPEVFHRWKSLRMLKRRYGEWLRAGWRPDVILMCNFSPVYNGFIRWLKAQPIAPPVVVYLADSMNLQREFPFFRRVRHAFKPLKWPDSVMVNYVDACAAVSLWTQAFFAARNLPWMWLPSGCDPQRAVRDRNGAVREGPITLGYFGTLAAHGGLPALLKVFAARPRNASLQICGYGKSKDRIAEFCGKHPGLRFFGPRTPDACLQLAQTCDVLVNPRPLVAGNENNMSSKVFEYGLSGRAILTTRVSGVDEVLGERAYYFDENDFEPTLDRSLDHVASVPRPELDQRGREIQKRLVSRFSWPAQGERLAAFIQKVVTSHGSA